MSAMKSLYVAILLVMLGILSLSFLAYRSISGRIEKAYFDPVFDEMEQLQIESARAALNQGGPSAVSAYMQRLDQLFGGSHYLVDGHGTDVVSGKNREELLPKLPATKSRIQLQDHMVITHRSDDGRYWFLVVAPLDKSHPWMLFPYYILAATVVALLCWIAAVGLISPIRKVSKTAALFGRGELRARVVTRRQDEIGQLARSFNQMADRLERLITSERRLLEDISHELRSPLSRLKLATKLARTSLDQQAALDRIERDVDRMASLMSDIVEITRMEGDPSPLNMVILNLDSLVEAIIEDCLIEAEMHGCRLAVSSCATTQIEGNRELLRRAIENVVRNAIRYSPPQSVVDVIVNEESSMAKIEVRDRGPGVPEEYLTTIFEPFFRIEEARDTTRGGTGLGLSIAKRAIQLHFGTISAENANPGLRVAMSFPISRVDAVRFRQRHAAPLKDEVSSHSVREEPLGNDLHQVGGEN
jgi:signal transduction histidine kinase